MSRWSVIIVGSVGLVVLAALVIGLASDAEDDDTFSTESEASQPTRVVNLPPPLTLPAVQTVQQPVQPASGSDQVTETLIIKTGTVSLIVEDIDTAFDQIADMAAKYGGYIQRSGSTHSEERHSASITITVEAVQFEDAIADLRAISVEVKQVTVTGEDVSAEYVDLDSQLRNLESTHTRLLSFLVLQPQIAQQERLSGRTS